MRERRANMGDRGGNGNDCVNDGQSENRELRCWLVSKQGYNA